MLQAQWWAVNMQGRNLEVEVVGCRPCLQDVFSYGMVLWELLTFKTPWKDASNAWQVGSALQGALILATLHCTTGVAHKLALQNGWQGKWEAGSYVPVWL